MYNFTLPVPICTGVCYSVLYYNLRISHRLRSAWRWTTVTEPLVVLTKYVFLCVGSLQTRSGDVCHGSARGGFHIFCPLRGSGQQCRGHEERAHQGKPISTKHIRTMLLQLPGTIKTFLLIHKIWSIIKLFDRSHSFFIHCCT